MRSNHDFGEVPLIEKRTAKSSCFKALQDRGEAPNRGEASGLLGKDEVPSSNLGSSSKKPVSPLGMLVFSCFYLIFELGTSSTNIIKRGPQWRRREAPSPRRGNLGSSSKQKTSPKGLVFLFGNGTFQITKTKPSEAVLFWRGRIIPPVNMFRLAGTYDPAVLF